VEKAQDKWPENQAEIKSKMEDDHLMMGYRQAVLPFGKW
jgi:hypothetical protein